MYGQAVTLTAMVASTTSTPTGSVPFMDGTVVLATVVLDASQHASYTTSSLMSGTHTLTAVYTGNLLLAESTSAALAQVIDAIPSDFTLGLNTTTLTLKASQQGTVNALLTSLSGSDDAIDLSCAGLPLAASCTFANSPVALTQGQAVTVPVRVAKNGSVEAASVLSGERLGWGVSRVLATSLPRLILLGFGRKKRSSIRLLTLMVTAGVMSGLSGCSGKSPAHTSPGMYMITVTARGRSSLETHTAVFTWW